MKGLAAVCSLVVDCYRFLADSLSLLHQAAEGQGAPETLLLSGRKTNSLHFTCWTSTRSNVILRLRHVCVHSEYWHSWAGGRPRGRRSHWSSRNVLHLSLCQLLLPRGVQPGLDERCILFAFLMLELELWLEPFRTLTSPLCLAEKIFSDDIPKCDKCNSLVKPGQWIFVSVGF